MLIALELPPQAPATSKQLCGPQTRLVKGAIPGSSAFSLSRVTKQALREIPGAVVVVEEDGPALINKLPPSLRLSLWNLRIFSGREDPIFAATPSMPVWMNPNITTSGGNIVHKVYNLGGGSF
ncbi:MAG: hypothetical protein Q8O00_11725 [Holophaga sp.]|nr:hypothetical protein [Holophaga sp.]